MLSEYTKRARGSAVQLAERLENSRLDGWLDVNILHAVQGGAGKVWCMIENLLEKKCTLLNSPLAPSTSFIYELRFMTFCSAGHMIKCHC